MSYRRRRNTTFVEATGQPLSSSRTTLDDDDDNERVSPLLLSSPTHHHHHAANQLLSRPQQRGSPTSLYHVTTHHQPQQPRRRNTLTLRNNHSRRITVPYYIFLLGGMSVGAVLLLQLYSFILLSHMTHIQNIHNHNSIKNMMQWSPFWWLWQSSGDNDHHRRVNTLLRTSSDFGNANDVQRQRIEEHVFRTMVQLETSSTDRVAPRFRHVQRPKTLLLRFRHDQNQPDHGNLQHNPTHRQQRSNRNRSVAWQISKNSSRFCCATREAG